MKYGDAHEKALRLTAFEKHHAADVAHGSAVADLSGEDILLVKDNATNREIAKKIVFETGVEIVKAVDGKEAVNAFMNSVACYFDLSSMDM